MYKEKKVVAFNQMMTENNRVTLEGEVASGFTFAYEVFGETFYSFELKVNRLSETQDYIPVVISGRIIDVNDDWLGQYVRIVGQFRSFNKHESTKNRLILSVHVKEMECIEAFSSPSKSNSIILDGYICKKPIYRKTPLGRKIADVLIAVNRSYGKSDYIPCICWGRNAQYVSSLDVGAHLEISGRIQSRQYQKRISDEGEVEQRTAYEVSVSKIVDMGQ